MKNAMLTMVTALALTGCAGRHSDTVPPEQQLGYTQEDDRSADDGDAEDDEWTHEDDTTAVGAEPMTGPSYERNAPGTPSLGPRGPLPPSETPQEQGRVDPDDPSVSGNEETTQDAPPKGYSSAKRNWPE